MAEIERRKANARDAYKTFAEREFSQSLGKMSDKQRTLALTQFYVSEIHNALRYYIADEDFQDGYVDASGDLGADFVYRDDRRVLIIQAKYAKDGATTEAEDISHFQAVLERISDPKLKSNRRLSDALSDIDFKTDVFELRFVTLGRIDGQAALITANPIRLPRNAATKYTDLEDRISVEYLDERSLSDELRNALTVKTGNQTDATLVAYGERGRRSQIMRVPAEGSYESYVMVIGASQLLNLFSRYREGLFTLNIRNYIGNSTTNKQIQKTAIERPNDFYHLNNGIACIATSIQVGPDGHSVETKGLQVINGAQTVKSLVRSAKQWKENAEEPFVLMRLTQVPEGYGKGKNLREDIVRANNTQNVIKASDFRSNDAVQTSLVKHFDAYKRFGRSVCYVPKRTDRVTPNAYAIKLEDFAKTIYSFLNDPVAFSGSTSFLFDDSERGGYHYVFGDGNQIWDVMPDDDFRLRSAIWWYAVEIDAVLKKDRAQTTDPTHKAALERKWWLLFASRLVLERTFDSGYEKELARYYKGDWKFGEQSEGRWFAELYKRAKDGLVYVYTTESKNENFVHRNWMRNPKSVESLRAFFALAPSIPLPKVTELREQS